MDSLTNLTAAELEDLKLCGITSPAQLKRVSAAAVWADMQKAREFFPNHRFALTEERLQQICSGAEEQEVPETKLNKGTTAWDNLVITPTRVSTTGFKRRHHRGESAEEAQQEVSSAQQDSPLPQAGALDAEELAEDIRPAQRVSGLSKNFHAIHCNHSWSTYFGAIAAWLVIPSLAAMVLVPVLLLNGGDTQKVITYGVLAILLGVPHLFLSRMATCSVCHIGIFSFRNYPRNKAAHHLPLLGYTLATALHVLLFFQFRCPACGTQMKLFGRHHGKPHHH